MAKKVYDDDDGRTIADMSGLDFPKGLSFRGVRPKKPEPEREEEQSENSTDRPWEAQKDAMSREERRMYIFGALKATMLIAFAYIAGFGLLIWLLTALLK